MKWWIMAALVLGSSMTASAFYKEHVIEPGNDGFYSIVRSGLRTSAQQSEDIQFTLRVIHTYLNDSNQPPFSVSAVLGGNEAFEFDVFLGYLTVGDKIQLESSCESGAEPCFDELVYELNVEKGIPVSVLSQDVNTASRYPFAGEWITQSMTILQSGNEVTCSLAKDNQSGQGDITYLVPQSGTYALHDMYLRSDDETPVSIQLFVGDEPRSFLRQKDSNGRSVIDCDLGYLAKGQVVRFTFSGMTSDRRYVLDAEISSWAVRRPPLRVHRGADSYLNAYDPEAPRNKVEIPPENWIEVMPTEGDATLAIRKALADAISKQQGDQYTGVRLQRGALYVVASEQIGGRLFEIEEANRLIFDGNGAILQMNSPAIQRKHVYLFSVRNNSRKVVLADLKVVCPLPPFSTGTITHVTPVDEDNSELPYTGMTLYTYGKGYLMVRSFFPHHTLHMPYPRSLDLLYYNHIPLV